MVEKGVSVFVWKNDCLDFHGGACVLLSTIKSHFQYKNPKCLSIFNLIHSNVRDPSRVPNNSGSDPLGFISWNQNLRPYLATIFGNNFLFSKIKK